MVEAGGPLSISGSPPATRRERLRRRVLGQGYARIDDLARDLDVSIMTVHRDLDVLEREGWLTKIRGGATANPSAVVDAGVRERGSALADEKASIAAAAADLVVAGQTVFIDDSTTALGLVPHLISHPPLVVATNFIPVVHQLAGAKGIEVTVLGGSFHPRQEACFGLQTVDAISRLHADVLFMSTTAVTAGACFHRSEVTVMVKRAFMTHATRTVLMVDHAKFGRPAPHLLCRVNEFDVVVTDAGVDPEDLDGLRQSDVEVRVAAAGASSAGALPAM